MYIYIYIYIHVYNKKMSRRVYLSSDNHECGRLRVPFGLPDRKRLLEHLPLQSRFRVQGPGCWVQGPGSRVQDPPQSRVYLTPCIDLMILESQFTHKIVNLLF